MALSPTNEFDSFHGSSHSKKKRLTHEEYLTFHDETQNSRFVDSALFALLSHFKI